MNLILFDLSILLFMQGNQVNIMSLHKIIMQRSTTITIV